mgnify:CR=1 FL=1
MRFRNALLLGAAVGLLSGCAMGGGTSTPPASASDTPRTTPAAEPVNSNPFPSTYRAYPSQPTAIVGGTILDGEGARIDNGVVLLRDGRVEAVGGADLAVPDGYTRIDARGRYVTPGIIDIHSHLGAYPSPAIQSTSDGNEATSPTTPEVWVEHSVWPQDPGFSRALVNGGVTSLQILPGSANLFGGRSVTLKNVPARTMQGMKFPGAPYGLKMACGENPKRVYGSKGRMPSTRMGNMAVDRQTWAKAAAYKKKLDEGKPVDRAALPEARSVAAAAIEDRRLDLQEPGWPQGVGAGRCGGLSRADHRRRAGERKTYQLPHQQRRCDECGYRGVGRRGSPPGKGT